MIDDSNADKKVIEDFGHEWESFDYSSERIDSDAVESNFWQYFHIFPFERLPENACGFDMGSGSGRWAQFVAPRVKHLTLVEPSDALEVAQKNLSRFENISFLKETTAKCSLPAGSQDFGYCLGVLHHMPNTELGLKDCSRLIKPGGFLLLYLYYDFENRTTFFKLVWRCSDLLRRLVSQFPGAIKRPLCDFIAAGVYWPISRVARVAEGLGFDASKWLLADYRRKPFYQLRNDALDRFGTRIEKRFSRAEITEMLVCNGFKNIIFSDQMPYWTCLGEKD